MTQNSSPIRILHVDDEPEFAELAADFIERHDERFAVETAVSAADGLDQLADDGFDCIVSDYDMPGQDGLEFLDAVREDHPELPFILYTGKGSEEVASEAISSGVTDYLQKETGTSQYEVLANRVENSVIQHRVRRNFDRERLQRTALFENTPDPIMEVEFDDDTPIITEVNAAFEEVFGYEEESVIGRSVTETVVPESERDEHLSLRDEVLRGVPVETEVRRQTKDGVRDFVLRIIPIEATEISEGAYAWYTDVTDRKQRERELQEQRDELRRYERAIEGSSDLLAAIDKEYNYLFANEQYRDHHGVSQDEIAELSAAEVLEGQWETKVKPMVDQVLEGEEVRYEMERHGSDGATRSYEIQYYPMRDENGSVEGVVGGLRDITKRKVGSQNLELMEQIVLEMNDGAVIAQEGRIEFTNPQVTDLVGYSEEELLGKPMLEFIAPEYRDLVKERHQERLAGDGEELPERYEIAVVTKDGKQVPVEINVSRIEYQVEPATVSVVRDISDRKKREEQLEAAQELKEALSTTFPDYTFIYNAKGEYLDVITGWERDTDQYSSDELIGSNVEELLSKEPAIRIQTAIQRTLETEELQTIEYAIEGPDRTRWYEANLAPLEAGYNGEEAVVLSARNVTERIERERELERSENRFRTLAENFPNGAVLIFDTNLRYQSAYGEGFEMAGFDPADFEDQHFSDVFDGETLDTKREMYEATLEGESRQRGMQFAGRQYRVHTLPVHGATGEIQAGIVMTQDITEYRQREQTLERQNERLDEFASIVSHDLRNPLRVAEGNLELALENPEKEPIESALEALDRMEDLIEDLLGLARQGQLIDEIEDVQLASVVEGCWDMVDSGEADLEIEGELTFLADPDRVRQLIENLFRNAIDHVGRDVSIQVGVLDSGDGFFVADDGLGIPEEEQDQLFESGFTTGEEGTGFGLAIVAEIVEAHGWEIDVTASNSGGARFEISGVELVAD